MAIFNHKTGKYEATKYMKRDGSVLVGEGDTKEEANKELKEIIALWRTIKLDKTKRGTFARSDLAEHINTLVENETSKD